VGFRLLYRPSRYRSARDPDRIRDGGVGGSYAYADTATGIAFALTKNRLTPGFDTAEQILGIVTEPINDGGDAPRRSDEPESDLPTGLGKLADGRSRRPDIHGSSNSPRSARPRS
jgi:CubicO group peptidase (beta-lactamase class C family)